VQRPLKHGIIAYSTVSVRRTFVDAVYPS